MRTGMLTSSFAALVAAGALAIGQPVEARDDGRRHHDRGHSAQHHGWSDRDYRQGYRDGRRDARHDRRHGHPGRGYGPPPRVVYHAPPPVVIHAPPPRVVYSAPVYRAPPRWERGYRIHDYHWAPTYVVVDYHRYGLRHPPHGHHWRRDDRGNWLLVGIATGIVVDAILNR